MRKDAPGQIAIHWQELAHEANCAFDRLARGHAETERMEVLRRVIRSIESAVGTACEPVAAAIAQATASGEPLVASRAELARLAHETPGRVRAAVALLVDCDLIQTVRRDLGGLKLATQYEMRWALVFRRAADRGLFDGHRGRGGPAAAEAHNQDRSGLPALAEPTNAGSHNQRWLSQPTLVVTTNGKPREKPPPEPPAEGARPARAPMVTIEDSAKLSHPHRTTRSMERTSAQGSATKGEPVAIGVALAEALAKKTDPAAARRAKADLVAYLREAVGDPACDESIFRRAADAVIEHGLRLDLLEEVAEATRRKRQAGTITSSPGAYFHGRIRRTCRQRHISVFERKGSDDGG